MRVTIISDSPYAATGFGKQTKLVARELVRRGIQVTVLSRDEDNLPDNKESDIVEIRVVKFFDPAILCNLALQTGFDVCLVIRNSSFIKSLWQSEILQKRIYFWFANENEDSGSLEKWVDDFPDRSIIPISYSVAARIPERKRTNPVYHALDFSLVPRSRHGLREKWSATTGRDFHESDLLLISVERNDLRKNWEASCALVGRLVDAFGCRTITILAIAKKGGRNYGFDLAECARFHGVNHHLCDLTDLDLSDRDIFELLAMSDLRISCAGAEGFGLGLVEAAAARIPQVLIRLSVHQEILGESSPFLVDPLRLAIFPNDGSYLSSKVYAIPDVDKMATRAKDLLQSKFITHVAVNDAYTRIANICEVGFTVDSLWKAMALPTC